MTARDRRPFDPSVARDLFVAAWGPLEAAEAADDTDSGRPFLSDKQVAIDAISAARTLAKAIHEATK